MSTSSGDHAGHEDVGAAIHAVIPPRPVPFWKRWLWRIVIAVLQTAVGRRWFAKRFEH
jgi:hypothetical protein